MLIGRTCCRLRGSTPQPQPADSSIWGDGETDVTDRTAQNQIHVAVVMSVVRTKLQHAEEDTMRRFV